MENISKIQDSFWFSLEMVYCEIQDIFFKEIWTCGVFYEKNRENGYNFSFHVTLQVLTPIRKGTNY